MAISTKVTRLANGKFQVRWRDRERKQRAKNCRSFVLANDFAKKIERGLVLSESGSLMIFREFAEKWIEDYCKVHKSPTQHLNDPRTIGKYLLPAFGGKRLSSLTKMDLVDLQARLKIEGRLMTKSINLITALARAMLEIAVSWELLETNPFRGVRPLREDRQPFAYWSIEERERFLVFCRREDPAFAELVEFACHTGMRIGEITGLKKDCLYFEREAIVVHRSFNRTVGRHFETTKGHQSREVPMNPAVQRILLSRRLLAPTQLVFTLNPSHASRQLKRIARLADVKVLKFHDLRHTFASHLAMADVPIQKIQVLLGHSEIKQTMRYAHLHPSFMRGSTDVLCAPGVHAPLLTNTGTR